MTLVKSKSKNATSLYVTKSIYNNGKRTSIVVEKLGTISELKDKLGEVDPIEWAQEYVKELTRQEKDNKKDEEKEIIIKYSSNKIIVKDERRVFSGGYLFLQKIYLELGINKICNKIKKKYKYDFDLDSILSRLIYGRIIFPSSKLATFELSQKLIEPPNFDIQHLYRGLEVIAKETDYIQSELYKSSTKIIKRKTGIIYYDCTNYFFEIEQEEGLKQYGCSKEHRPNPIVQMGLFMDGDGIPLAFSIDDGSTNEQITLKPLEKKILSDFELSKFVVCTDAGLSSISNRKYNNISGRAFITTQSIKKLKKHLKEWALDYNHWRLPNSDKLYNIDVLDDQKYKDYVFYKERWIKEDDLEQKLIVTYSIKYRNYQRTIRNEQIERAKKIISTNPSKLKTPKQNDYKRFIDKKNITKDGEIAQKEVYTINTATIELEEQFDGFYGVCTNLDDEPEAIIKINHRRWEIEESFRIMKTEFKARPVYLKRDDRIKAHFTTCFISLLIYRILEKKLDEKFTCCDILNQLRNMNFLSTSNGNFIPAYTRTDFTDTLHDIFGFRTDYQIITKKTLKNFFT